MRQVDQRVSVQSRADGARSSRRRRITSRTASTSPAEAPIASRFRTTPSTRFQGTKETRASSILSATRRCTWAPGADLHDRSEMSAGRSPTSVWRSRRRQPRRQRQRRRMRRRLQNRRRFRSRESSSSASGRGRLATTICRRSSRPRRHNSFWGERARRHRRAQAPHVPAPRCVYPGASSRGWSIWRGSSNRLRVAPAVGADTCYEKPRQATARRSAPV